MMFVSRIGFYFLAQCMGKEGFVRRLLLSLGKFWNVVMLRDRNDVKFLCIHSLRIINVDQSILRVFTWAPENKG